MSDERMTEIILLLTPERARLLGDKLARLQALYGARSLVETIERAVDEALRDS